MHNISLEAVLTEYRYFKLMALQQDLVSEHLPVIIRNLDHAATAGIAPRLASCSGTVKHV